MLLIKIKKAFCDAFIEKVYVFDYDDGDDGNGKGKKARVKIIFDAFESEGLLGFDDAEIEFENGNTWFTKKTPHCRCLFSMKSVAAKRVKQFRCELFAPQK